MTASSSCLSCSTCLAASATARSLFRLVVMSMIDASTSGRPVAGMGWRPISTGTSLPSLRRPKSSRTAPIARILRIGGEVARARVAMLRARPLGNQHLDGASNELRHCA